jgi:hypothetical protein
LIGTDPDKLKRAALELLDANHQTNPKKPPLWDGKAATRICDELVKS